MLRQITPLAVWALLVAAPGLHAQPVPTSAPTTIPDRTIYPPHQLQIDLLDYFDPIFARVETTQGSFDIRLERDATPLTVTNFLDYTRAGAYTDNLIHRSIPGFVIQAGGFSASLPPRTVSTFPPVPNEFGISNTRGTLAMAKLGNDPDSATS